MSDDVNVNVISGSGEPHPAAKLFNWTDSPKMGVYALWGSVAGLIVTAALMVAYPNKHPAPWEAGPFKLIAFGAIGVVACGLLLVCTKLLMSALSRPENFYGEEGDHDT